MVNYYGGYSGFGDFGYPFIGGFLGGLLGNVIYPNNYRYPYYYQPYPYYHYPRYNYPHYPRRGRHGRYY
ncbi:MULTISPECIES: hypothetical protein [Lysinibacillus]|uniref:Uncharacterized protein n=1 Tax=Lysinibacillus antri TaxID=2498145 RepID=A0A432L722_9BACI|nr:MULTISPECIES: hypothetical protein [Lysinibacillus]RUL46934.1 hypothetical protein EK386_18850 [Lysinibacillus antri]TSI10459.1 hypothetical protein FJQ64_04015 [Lysinibacillus sp. BW-2-10]